MTLCCAKWTANTALCSTGDMASALWLHGCADCCWAHTWSLSHEQHSVILSSFKLAGGLNSKLASSVGGGLQCIRSMDPTMQIQVFNTWVVKLVCATEQLWKEWQRLIVSRFRQNHLLNALNVNEWTGISFQSCIEIVMLHPFTAQENLCACLTRSSTRSLMAVTPSTTTRGISVVYQGRVEISGIILKKINK